MAQLRLPLAGTDTTRRSKCGRQISHQSSSRVIQKTAGIGADKVGESDS